MAQYVFDPSKPGEAVNLGGLVNEGETWCVICNRDVGPDVGSHFATEHSMPTKQRTDIASWDDRTKDVVKRLRRVLNNAVPKEQIDDIVESILALYQIRVQIAGKMNAARDRS
jgi:hypothetical protein